MKIARKCTVKRMAAVHYERLEPISAIHERERRGPTSLTFK
tara:strand:- start:939 stop:1061 length:123 start_codon:yes stop_codon:yes gene_type:complete